MEFDFEERESDPLDHFEECPACQGHGFMMCINPACSRCGRPSSCPVCEGAGAVRVFGGHVAPADCLRLFVRDEAAAVEIVRRVAGFDCVEHLAACAAGASGEDRIEICPKCRGACTLNDDRHEAHGGHERCPCCDGSGALHHADGGCAPATHVDVFVRDDADVLEILGRVGGLAQCELLKLGRRMTDGPRGDA
jgi:hypothetical protein